MTSEYSREALRDWQRANADARAAEAILEEAMTLAVHWNGPAVAEHLLQEVVAYRSRADAKLRAAFKAIEPHPARPTASTQRDDTVPLGSRAVAAR